MLLLALDTATPAVTVAVHDGDRVLARAGGLGGQRHAELLSPAIAEALAAAGATPGDLTAVAVGVGPGPFTGLRVGLVTAYALGDALDVPVHGVGTLDALAWASGLDEPFLVATDARRKEVYWADYADRATPRTAPAVDKPAAVATGRPVVGEGPVLYPDAFPDARGPVHPDAGALAELAARRLAAGEPLPEPAPLYLRRPDATPGVRKRVLPQAVG